MTEKDISKLTPYVEQLDFLGKVFDVIGAFQLGETIFNWNSSDKIKTEIDIFVNYKNYVSYSYHAFVDNDLLFAEFFTEYTSVAISPEDPIYQITVS